MPINELEQQVLDRIDSQRLLDLTLELVKIPSPTGHETEIANYYADVLREIGLDVEMDYEYPNSPTVLGWLRGAEDGPTFQLDGHTDTVPLEHDPPRYEDGLIYGRGSCDMKCGVAGMAEAVRAIRESGLRLKGDLLVSAHGMHERPGAQKESVISLAQSEHLGDAVLIAEGDDKGVPVAHKGLVIFDMEIRREGPTMHEMAVPPDAVHPLRAGWRMVQLLQDRAEELAAGPRNPYLGSDSLFIGMFEGGEFFNTLPTHARIWGTRRWIPGSTHEEVMAELEGFARQVEQETGATVQIDLDKVGEAAETDEDARLIHLVKASAEDVSGKTWPITGMHAAGDAWIFINVGQVPCTYHGAGGARAHSNPEYVALSDVVRAAKVYALTALRYVGYQ